MITTNGVLIVAGWRRRQLDTMIRRQLKRKTQKRTFNSQKSRSHANTSRAALLRPSNIHFYVDSCAAITSLYDSIGPNFDIMGDR